MNQLFYSRCPHNTRERERSVQRGHVVYSSPKCGTLNAALGISGPRGILHVECKECGKVYHTYPKKKEQVVENG